MKKIQRQSSAYTSTPPSSGPATIASPPIADQRLIATAR